MHRKEALQQVRARPVEVQHPAQQLSSVLPWTLTLVLEGTVY